MGRIQKLREQKKLEELQKQDGKSRRTKKILTGTVIGVAIFGIIIYGTNAIFANKKTAASPSITSSPSATIPAITPAKNQIFPSLAPNNNLTTSSQNMTTQNKVALIETDRGNIKLELYTKDAPKTVANFVDLINKGFYDSLTFHRVVAGFVIQGGDPKGDGTGGPGYTFEDEINPWSLGLDTQTIQLLEAQGYKYTRDLTSHKVSVGALAMANSGPDTNGSQFFIVTDQDQNYLNGKHTVFGQVIEGMDVVRKIQQGDIMKKVTIIN